MLLKLFFIKQDAVVKNLKKPVSSHTAEAYISVYRGSEQYTSEYLGLLLKALSMQ